MGKFAQLILSLLLFGCAASQPFVASGDRSAGIVEITWSQSVFQQQPGIEEMVVAELDAERRCRAWGYNDAEPFSGMLSVCTERDHNKDSLLYGQCTKYQHTLKVQCISE